jgi:ABC-type transport system substrate-binding protein
VAQALEAGIRFAPRAHPGSSLRGVIDEGSPAYLWSWNVGYESGSALRDFFHTPDPAGGLGVRNHSGYSSREVDQLLEQALATVEPGPRGRLLQRASRRLAADLPWIPLLESRALRVFPREAWFASRLDGLLVLSAARSEPPPAELLAQP